MSFEPQPNKAGGAGKCPHCGHVLPNIAFHQTVCELNPERTAQPQPDSAHLQAWYDIHDATRLSGYLDKEKVLSVLAKHFPTPPALTGGDAELSEVLLTCDGAGRKAKEDALNELLRRYRAEIHDAASRQHESRITALSAQVAELSHDLSYHMHMAQSDKARIAELERDKARLEQQLSVIADLGDVYAYPLDWSCHKEGGYPPIEAYQKIDLSELAAINRNREGNV